MEGRDGGDGARVRRRTILRRVRHGVASAVLVVLAVALPGAAGAAPGDLDPSFGNGGIVTTDFGTGAHAYALAILPNGKIIAAGGAGSQHFALARYLPDGSLDPVFDGDGKVTTDLGAAAGDGANGLAIQPNGRIVAAGGSGDFVLARYRRDGSLDQSFGADGKVTTDFGGTSSARTSSSSRTARSWWSGSARRTVREGTGRSRATTPMAASTRASGRAARW